MVTDDEFLLVVVRIFGTEDRECDVFIGSMKEIRPVISFNKSGILSINFISDVVTDLFHYA